MLLDPIGFQPIDWQRYLKKVTEAESEVDDIIKELRAAFSGMHTKGCNFDRRFEQALGLDYRVDMTPSRHKSLVDPDIITGIITQYAIHDADGRRVFEKEFAQADQNKFRSLREVDRQQVQAFEHQIAFIYASYEQRMDALAELTLAEQLQRAESPNAAIYFYHEKETRRAVIDIAQDKELSYLTTEHSPEPADEERAAMRKESEGLNVYWIWHASAKIDGHRAYTAVRRLLSEAHHMNTSPEDELVSGQQEEVLFEWKQTEGSHIYRLRRKDDDGDAN